MMTKNGFTLIELLIAIAVIGILTAIAYPSYQDSIQKTRRAEAQGDLMELASFMERYFTESNTYVGAALPFTNSPRAGTAFYTIGAAIAPGPPSTFTLTAIPQAGQSNDPCGNLTINNVGATGSANNCW